MEKPTAMPAFLRELSFAFLDAVEELETIHSMLSSPVFETLIQEADLKNALQKKLRQAWMLVHLTAAAFDEGWLSNEAMDEIVMNDFHAHQKRRGLSDEELRTAFGNWKKELETHAGCWRRLKGNVGNSDGFDLLKVLKGEAKP